HQKHAIHRSPTAAPQSLNLKHGAPPSEFSHQSLPWSVASVTSSQHPSGDSFAPRLPRQSRSIPELLARTKKPVTRQSPSAGLAISSPQSLCHVEETFKPSKCRYARLASSVLDPYTLVGQ